MARARAQPLITRGDLIVIIVIIVIILILNLETLLQATNIINMMCQSLKHCLYYHFVHLSDGQQFNLGEKVTYLD